MLQIKEGPTTRGGAGRAVLVGSACPVLSEFDAQAQALAARHGVSIHHARLILRALRLEVF